MQNADRLASALEALQKERIAFLRLLEGLSQRALDFQPSKDAWSVGQVAHHVALTEKVFQGNVAELLRSGAPDQGAFRAISFDELPMGPRMIPTALLRLPPFLLPFTIMSSLMPQSLQSALLSNPVVRIRTAPVVEPKAAIPRAELLSLLKKVRKATLDLLEPVKSWDLSRFRWSHPLMGTHDIYGTLELLASHDRRHAGQISRIQTNAKFPKP